MRILVVEPDPIYRKLFPIWIRDHCESAGLEIVAAEGAEEALAAARMARPDVLLTAFELGGSDGLRLAQRMQSPGGGPAVVVVAQATYLRLRRRLAKTPGAHYLAKPVGEKTFVETMQSALHAARASGRTTAEATARSTSAPC